RRLFLQFLELGAVDGAPGEVGSGFREIVWLGVAADGRRDQGRGCALLPLICSLRLLCDHHAGTPSPRRAPSASTFSLSNAVSRGTYSRPQDGLMYRRSGGT